jgi:hypothetical protein
MLIRLDDTVQAAHVHGGDQVQQLVALSQPCTPQAHRHCQLNRAPLYSPHMVWHTCSMKAAPRVRSARFSSNNISIWSCHAPLHIAQLIQTPSVSSRTHQPGRVAVRPVLPQLP